MTLAEVFAQCAAQERRALIPYLTAGYPTETTFLATVKAFARAGADIIEIGLPFSDPLADGPTIQHSSQTALERGMTVERALNLLGQLSPEPLPPLVIMSYYNPLLQFGLAAFMARAAAVGVRGLIVPDIIVEEGRAVEQAAAAAGIDLVYLLAPTSSARRQAMVLRRSRGFVYLVSVTGVTGARAALPPGLNAWIKKVKKQSRVPVAVGFGISGPAAAQSVARVADGVVVGSAIIDKFKNGDRPAAQVERATTFLRSLQKAVRRPGATA